MAKQIEKRDIEMAQKIWAERIVEIGKVFFQKNDFRAVAKRLIDDLYGYREGAVLFKPTKAREIQFRLNEKGALSYFVGEDDHFPEDQGFALQPWKAVRFENAGFILDENYAVAMGNYFFTDYNGNKIQVEYTLGYFKSAGGLKINLHHSSLPFSAG